MIVGHGIDLQEIDAIEAVYKKRPHFAQKVLTPAELERFEDLKGRRQIEFLAGRWAAKEAYAKALGTGIGPVGFHDLEVLNDEKGAPYFSRGPHAHSWLSISHSANYVQASVILEEEDEN